ncbi:hypothetical protein F5Y08DRAFT_169447 [Xylaria arbuscula]|nr:hypothetical protein F5Y08DRAFT_169447 [Xylaria arbuscula]
MTAPTADIPPLADGPLELTLTDFNTTVEDVLAARRLLASIFPMEIALLILSFASYRPRRSSIKHVKKRYGANEFWRPGPIAHVAGMYLTLQLPSASEIPETVARPKSITFQMDAADQGWADNGGDGTYHNSHTWFEASILRRPAPADAEAILNIASLAVDGPLVEDWSDMQNFPSPLDARHHLRGHGWEMLESGDGSIAWRVHNNVTACREYRRYCVRWEARVPTAVADPRAMGDGKGFLELLRPDDVVVLWARAEQQAWVNKVRAAAIEIEYELF